MGNSMCRFETLYLPVTVPKLLSMSEKKTDYLYFSTLISACTLGRCTHFAFVLSNNDTQIFGDMPLY